MTCDNASCNDTMIDELARLLDKFPGAENRTRCFSHILNLVAKCILKQFDVPKARAGIVLDDAAAALQDLAGEIETEEEDMGRDMSREADDDRAILDARGEMGEDELTELEESTRPVQHVLLKVNFLNYIISVI